MACRKIAVLVIYMKLFSRELNPGAILKQRAELSNEKINKALLAELKRRRKKGILGTRVPNNYTVILSPDDYRVFATRKTIDELSLFVKRQVICLDIYLEDKLAITIKGEASIPNGKCKVSSLYSEEKKSILAVSTDTVVVDKSDYTLPIAHRNKQDIACLQIASDEDKVWYLGEDKVYIGRQEKNDILLEDNTISRLHGYIAYENHRHIIYDADSLNGIYVNGSRIQHQYLCIGDEILLGQTRLIYDIKDRPESGY